MERQKEIQQAAFKIVGGNIYDEYFRKEFIKGAEWSDEHPKEGLVSIDKIIDWLMQHINDYIVRGRDIDYMFDDLRKAIQNEIE